MRLLAEIIGWIVLGNFVLLALILVGGGLIGRELYQDELDDEAADERKDVIENTAADSPEAATLNNGKP
jgi:hypothetical protein